MRLQKAMQDKDDEVRSAARSALLEFVKAAPSHAEKVLPPLQEAMRDDHWGVRSASSEALVQISLPQLIATYWATQNQALKQRLIPLIAPQLYQTPLVVRTSLKPNHQQLILYPTAGKPIPWDKPEQEVKNFVKLIKSAAKRREEAR